MPKYSIIVPVYNRPDEVEDLLESLSKQTFKDFDIVLMEDGSTKDCKSVVDQFKNQLSIDYHFKPNTGPGDSRNQGMALAKGEYLIFFDSDCIIPPQYFEEVEQHLSEHALDAFGGPDAAHDSFSNIQKAINYAMTSVITTGGIRGKKNKLDTYQPRSFNMGMHRKVYEKVGGYIDVNPGEDPDLSYRIMDAGFKVGLIEKAYVYHKRRIDFSKFTKQVYRFGTVRIFLIKWYPERFKLTYTLPTNFLLFSALCILGSLLFMTPWFMAPLGFISLVLFIDALIRTKHLGITFLAVAASFIQLYVYGWGFLKSAIQILVLKKDERKAYPKLFFDKKKLAAQKSAV